MSMETSHPSPLPLPPYSAFIGKLDMARRPYGMVVAIVSATCILEVLLTSLRLGFPGFKDYNITTLHALVIVCALLTPLRASWIPALVMGLCANAQAFVFYGAEPTLGDWLHYVIPRLAIPAVTVLAYNLGRRLAKTSYYLPLMFAAVFGTAANTILYSAWFASRIWLGVAPAPRVGTRPYSTEFIVEIVRGNFPLELLIAVVFVIGVGHILRISAVAYSRGPALREQSISESSQTTGCFVLSPFGEPYDSIYIDVIRPLFAELEIPVQRADEFACSNIIMDDVRHAITEASLIVADLTGKNANVFYELGYAHALGKYVLLITQDIRELPFDVRHYRCCGYGAEADESWLELRGWLRRSVLELTHKEVPKVRG